MPALDDRKIENRYSHRFQVNCKTGDPIHEKAALLLRQQGKGMTQFIIQAIVMASTQAPPSPEEWLDRQRQFLGMDIEGKRQLQMARNKPIAAAVNAAPQESPEPLNANTAPDRTKMPMPAAAEEADDEFYIEYDAVPFAEDAPEDDADAMDSFFMGMNAFG